MFNTAKNTIKKAAKDQVEFVGAILTGVFVGSIFTFAYVKYDVKTTLSFADIGGMLAGIGTVGLLVTAVLTAQEWKKQSRHHREVNSLDKYSSVVESFFWQSKRISLLLAEYIHPPLENNSTTIQEIDFFIQQLRKIDGLSPEITASINQLNRIWGVKINDTPLVSCSAAMTSLRHALEKNSNISNKYSDAQNKFIENEQNVKDEIDRLYRQLKKP